MNRIDLKKLSRAIQEGFNCPQCGKSVLVKATGWKPTGGSRYDAAAHEAVDPDIHCTCPGGPVDTLQSARGE